MAQTSCATEIPLAAEAFARAGDDAKARWVLEGASALDVVMELAAGASGEARRQMWTREFAELVAGELCLI